MRGPLQILEWFTVMDFVFRPVGDGRWSSPLSPNLRTRSLYQLFDSLYDKVKGLWKDQSMLELQPR